MNIFAKQKQEDKTAGQLTAQEFVNVRDIRDGLLYSKDGWIFGFFETEPVFADLMTDEEKHRIAGLLTALMAAETEPFQLLVLPEPVDVSAIIDSLADRKREVVSEIRKTLFSMEIENLDNITRDNSVVGSKFVVKAWRKAAEAEPLKARLRDFAKRWEDGGIYTSILGDREILRLCNLYTNPVYAQLEGNSCTAGLTVPVIGGRYA